MTTEKKEAAAIPTEFVARVNATIAALTEQRDAALADAVKWRSENILLNARIQQLVSRLEKNETHHDEGKQRE